VDPRLNFNDIKFYESSRDDFLKNISENICKPCTAKQKEKMKVDYINPLKCGCRCERVENLLIIASNLDSKIKELKSKFK